MQLFQQSTGDGDETVVLLHGLFGQGSNLMPIARGLDRRYRCLLPDQRNHGRSPHHDSMSYELMAEDLRQLLDDAGAKSAHLLGHSMGGKVVMQFALRYPERVRSLVVADIAPVAYPRHHDSIFEALQALRATPPASRREAQAQLDAATGDSGVSAFLLMNWSRRTDGGYGWRFNLDALDACYSAIAAAPKGHAFEGPTLFLKGDESDYISPACRGATLALFPQSRLKVIAGAGHWLHAQKPSVFLRLVSDFFAAH